MLLIEVSFELMDRLDKPLSEEWRTSLSWQCNSKSNAIIHDSRLCPHTDVDAQWLVIN